MHWASASEFFAMGGYAFYVWGSYLLTAAVLAVEVWSLRRQARTKRAAPGRNSGGTNR